MQRIRKAVIPAAGLGTRFLPVTKAVPKELLPIVDIPTLQYIIEEAAASGIEEVHPTLKPSCAPTARMHSANASHPFLPL